MTSMIGIYGLGTVGQTFAFSYGDDELKCSAASPIPGQARQFSISVKDDELDEYITCFDKEDEFIKSLIKPRKILFSVKQDQNVLLKLLNKLKSLLQSGDIIIDLGYDPYDKYIERNKLFINSKINYVCACIGGGDLSYNVTPCIMVSTTQEIYNTILPVLKPIAADYNNKPCIALCEGDCSASFMRMVHNSIEYIEMQLIAEVYDMMKIFGLDITEISKIVANWNSDTNLKSQLLNITQIILTKQDCDVDNLPQSDELLLNKILDCVRNKGAGRSILIEGVKSGVSSSMLSHSVWMRFLSEVKRDRELMATRLTGPLFDFKMLEKDGFISDLKAAYHCSRLCLYDQIIFFIDKICKERNWTINYSKLFLSWSSGCTIESNLIIKLSTLLSEPLEVLSILILPEYVDILGSAQFQWRRIVALGVATGYTQPCLMNSLSYYDNIRRSKNCYNIISGLSDYIHHDNFLRIDKDLDEYFHCRWEKKR